MTFGRCRPRPTLVFAVLAALAPSPSARAEPGSDGALLFTYFTGNGEDGLRLAWSGDGFLARQGERYLLFYKDERKLPEAKKEILLATSDGLRGPWRVPTLPISPRNRVEGPSAIRIGGDWIVYFDAYTRHRYEAVRSPDLKSWTDVTDAIRFPEGARHGTVLEVSRGVLDALRTHFDAAEGSSR